MKILGIGIDVVQNKRIKTLMKNKVIQDIMKVYRMKIIIVADQVYI